MHKINTVINLCFKNDEKNMHKYYFKQLAFEFSNPLANTHNDDFLQSLQCQQINLKICIKWTEKGSLPVHLFKINGHFDETKIMINIICIYMGTNTFFLKRPQLHFLTYFLWRARVKTITCIRSFCFLFRSLGK
jgi:hypothetical protein